MDIHEKTHEEIQRIRATNEELERRVAILAARLGEAEALVSDLRDRERNYREVFNATSEAIFIQDALTGRILDVNASALEMYGFSSKEELRERGLAGLSAGSSPHTGEEALRRIRLAVDGRPQVFEWLARKRDGETFWVEVSLRASVIDDQGRVLAVVRDISERKKVDRALRESEERYAAVVKQSFEGIYLLDPVTKRILESNDAFQRMVGYTAQELDGIMVYDLVAHDQNSIDRIMRSVVSRKDCFIGERHYRHRNGTLLCVEASAKLISYGGKEALCVMVRNVMERKRAEEERAKLEAQLHHAQKMESVGRLAGGVAHDLNNLLTPILGYGEILLAGFAEPDDRRVKMEQILKAGTRARDLVRQLLAFSRKQVLEFHPMDLNEVVRAFEKLLRRTIREDIDIRIVAAPRLPLVRGDIGQLEQVIMNLAVNAQDAMPEGGILTMETSVADGAADMACEDAPPGSWVALEVRDTGWGMDDVTRDRLFEPFFTTKPKDRGTGLGLATCYGIIRQHGGDIRVTSEPGRGATFRILLPSFGGETGLAPIVLPVECEHPRGAETILLVEDDDSVRELAHAILEGQGYEVLSRSGGPSALEALEARNGAVDLLLTDVVMPEMNGQELFTRISRKYPRIRVLFMSGYTDDVIAHRGVLEHGVNFIQKPFSVRSLSHKVREVLDGRAAGIS